VLLRSQHEEGPSVAHGRLRPFRCLAAYIASVGILNTPPTQTESSGGPHFTIIYASHCCHSQFHLSNSGHETLWNSQMITFLILDLIMTILLFIYVPERLSLIVQALALPTI